MNRNKTARQHNFAVIPRSDVPRSKFNMRQTRKQAFNASELVPIMCEEVLPGDTWTHKESLMARFATPIAPVVDDIDLETWYFFVPNRIVWPDWEDFITGQDDALVVPKIRPYVNAGGGSYSVIANGLFDHFGILPQTYSDTVLELNVMPIWAYFSIFNQWFRDQNLQEEWEWSPTWTVAASNAITLPTGPVTYQQQLLRLNKRHDYFTASLPWPQKGQAVSLPLGTTAPVLGIGMLNTPGNPGVLVAESDGTFSTYATAWDSNQTTPTAMYVEQAGTTGFPNIRADLSAATSVTINAMRLAIATQHMLEKDARGGSRYIEQLLVHFGVRAPDYRLQLPEYLGGSKIPINVNPIAQTAAYDAEPDPTNASAIGNLGAEMHASSTKRTFNYAATEHGYIIGLAAVRATPTYQQGTRRHWRRQTRMDFYFPSLANLGEQAVATQEIYQNTTNVPTNPVWGYQERNAEYRYTPNEITGVLRSTNPAPLDWWHYAEEFGAEPGLNAAFITDKTQETLSRSLATIGSEQWSAQIIMDILHDSQVARLMPAYAVPGIDRF